MSATRALALLFLLALSAHASPLPQLDELWTQGLEAYSSKHFDEGVTHFSRWIEEAKKEGVQSPEAYRNLATCYFQKGDTGPAVINLLNSVSLNSSPVGIWTDLTKLGEIQKFVGVKENLVERLDFKTYFLLNSNMITMLACAAFWITFLGGAIYLLKKDWRILAALGSLGVFLGTVCALGLGNRLTGGHYGVLVKEKETIPLYRNPTAQDSDVLIHLPAGTIIKFSEQQGEVTHLHAPVAGWVRSNEVQMVVPN